EPLVVVCPAHPAHGVLHPRAPDGLAKLGMQSVHRYWLREAPPAPCRQSYAPMLAAAAPSRGGRAREALSGLSRELYQSLTRSHSKRTHDGPYSQWVSPSSSVTGSPSSATTSCRRIPSRRAMSEWCAT